MALCNIPIDPFDLSEPFHPVEQLLAVLPKESVEGLPVACQWLMTDLTSPIIDIYNCEIPIDHNGAQMSWLWVLLLPFIDSNRIHAAMSLCVEKMTSLETRRNSFGTSYLFTYKNVVDKSDNAKPSAGGEKDRLPVDSLSQDCSSIVPTVFGFVTRASSIADDLLNRVTQTYCNIDSNSNLHETYDVELYAYALPPYAPHRSRQLPNHIPPKSVLNNKDRSDLMRHRHTNPRGRGGGSGVNALQIYSRMTSENEFGDTYLPNEILDEGW